MSNKIVSLNTFKNALDKNRTMLVVHIVSETNDGIHRFEYISTHLLPDPINYTFTSVLKSLIYLCTHQLDRRVSSYLIKIFKDQKVYYNNDLYILKDITERIEWLDHIFIPIMEGT